MERVNVVIIGSLCLWVGSMIDPTKLQYVIAGALGALAVEGLVKFLHWAASKSRVHPV